MNETFLIYVFKDKSFDDVDLPPLPSEFMPSSLFERVELQKGMVTSTVRKPFGEIDLNKLKERKKRQISGTEDTFRAIERVIGEEIMEPFPEPTELGETMLHPMPVELFEMTGIVEHPEFPLEIPPVEEVPPVVLEPVAVVEEMAERPVEKIVPLEIKRQAKKLKIVLKRKIIIDEVKEISDKEMSKRSKHVSNVQPSDFQRVTVINKLPFVDLFTTNNREMRQRMFDKFILN